MEGEVDGAILPIAVPLVLMSDTMVSVSAKGGQREARANLPVSCAREILAKLVERRCHNPVSCVKRLLNAVAVVNIDVDVQHPLVLSAKQRV